MVGRDEVVAKVTSVLTQEKSSVLLVAMGGLGKTAISRVIAHDLLKKNTVNHLVWLDGAKGLLHATREVALMCKIDIEKTSWQDNFVDVLHSFSQPSVMVIDNLLNSCIDTTLFRRLKSCPVTILANARNKSSLFTEVIEVDFLSVDDCIEVFYSHTSHRCDGESLTQLIELFGMHTLTIELLAKIVDSTLITIPELLSQIKQAGIDLSRLPNTQIYGEHSGVVNDDSRTHSIVRHIEKLFTISGLNEEKQKVLGLIAKLPIGQYHGKNDLVPWLNLESGEPLVQVSSLGWLQRQGEYFSMHPVIASAILQQRMPLASEIERLTEVVISHAKPDEGGHWCYQMRYLPILRRLYLAFDQDVSDIHLVDAMAKLHEAIAEYDDALPLYKRVLEISEKALGKNHPEVATTLDNLAGLRRAMGKHDDALPLYQRALEIREKTLGKDHPHVATTLNNLAGLYEAMGRHDAALPLYERDLEISEKALGKDHPHVATTLYNLAGLYLAMGKHGDA